MRLTTHRCALAVSMLKEEIGSSEYLRAIQACEGMMMTAIAGP